MFASNQSKQSNNESQNNEKIIDPLTIWLIRIASLLIIIVLSGLLLGIPLAISLGQSILNETVTNSKEVIKNLIETAILWLTIEFITSQSFVAWNDIDNLFFK